MKVKNKKRKETKKKVRKKAKSMKKKMKGKKGLRLFTTETICGNGHRTM